MSLLAVSATAFAQGPCTKLFDPDGAVGNVSWHEPTYWTPEGEPGPTDVACILTDGMYQVVVSQPVTVAGFRLDVESGPTKVLVQGTQFTLNGLGTLTGDTKLKVNDGAVLRSDGGGSLAVYSKLVIEGGTVEVDVDLWGHLNWTSSASLTGGLTTHPGSRIEVEDPIGQADLTVAAGFEVHGSLVLNDAVPQTLTVTAGDVSVAWDGSLTTRAGLGTSTTAPELHAGLVNHGHVLVDGLGLVIRQPGAQHQNGATGVIEVVGAELEIRLGELTEVPSNFTNYGTTTVAGGGTIRVVGSTGLLEAPSNFTNYGTTTVAGGGTIRVVGSPTGDSPLQLVNGGDLDLALGGSLVVVDAGFATTQVGRVGGFGLLDLAGAASVAFDGSLAPGWSPGVLTVAGELPLGPTAMLAIEIGGEAVGAEHDRLDVAGRLVAGGTLSVDLIAPYHPSGGERYRVVVFKALDGWFQLLDLPPLLNNLAWNPVVGTSDVVLEVQCQGTQLAASLVADRDPVSMGYELVYEALITNASALEASDVVLSDPLPAGLAYRPDLSSPECSLLGGTVECVRPSLAPQASWQIAIGVDAVSAGAVVNELSVTSWECDTNPGDNSAAVSVNVVAAAPCDANYDLAVDPDDLPPAVGHIYGDEAPGNPDCRLGGGIAADDLSAIILEGDS